MYITEESLFAIPNFGKFFLVALFRRQFPPAPIAEIKVRSHVAVYVEDAILDVPFDRAANLVVWPVIATLIRATAAQLNGFGFGVTGETPVNSAQLPVSSAWRHSLWSCANTVGPP